MLARDNPFATDRVERLLKFQPEWSGTTWEALDQQWQSQQHRATITGRHGSGKTCFLNAWATRLKHTKQPAELRIFLNREQPSPTAAQWEMLACSQGKTIILDGEEQLSLTARARFYRLTKHAFGVLVTRHSQGRLPTLAHLNPSIEMLTPCVQKIASEHLAYLSSYFPVLWSKHHGNIRHILLECYDLLASEKSLANPD